MDRSLSGDQRNLGYRRIVLLPINAVPIPDGTITDPSLLPQHNVAGIEIFIDVNTPLLQNSKIAKPVWAGNAPYSLAGVSQINVVIPPGRGSGQVPIYVSLGRVVTSQSGMFTVQ